MFDHKHTQIVVDDDKQTYVQDNTAFSPPCPPYVTLWYCHIHDYSTEVELRFEPDSREAKIERIYVANQMDYD